jgi:hypothetical protein
MASRLKHGRTETDMAVAIPKTFLALGLPSRAWPPHPRFHPSPTLRSSLTVTPVLW